MRNSCLQTTLLEGWINTLDKKKEKIALFHPWIKSRGGAEKVVLDLARLKNFDVDVYTWVYEPNKTFEEFKKINVKVIAPKFAQKISRNYLSRGFFLLFSLFSKIPLEKYNKFLISTSGVGEFITFRNYKKGKTYAYVHTPLRDATKEIVEWNLENKYKNKFLKRIVYLSSVNVYLFLEKLAWKRLDRIIFNSELSQKRAKDRNLLKKGKSFVVYPPIELSNFVNSSKNNGKQFIYISRLNPPKRQDLLIEAWKNSNKSGKNELILIGTVENKNYHQKLLELSSTDKSIKILTDVNQKELKKIVEHAKAGIFLGYQEDFGMVPLEIIVAGKPLLAVDEGGYVKLIERNPLFHRIKEKHTRKEMIKEIENCLNSFEEKNYKKGKTKINIKDFKEEVEKVLNEN